MTQHGNSWPVEYGGVLCDFMSLKWHSTAWHSTLWHASICEVQANGSHTLVWASIHCDDMMPHAVARQQVGLNV